MVLTDHSLWASPRSIAEESQAGGARCVEVEEAVLVLVDGDDAGYSVAVVLQQQALVKGAAICVLKDGERAGSVADHNLWQRVTI